MGHLVLFEHFNVLILNLDILVLNTDVLVKYRYTCDLKEIWNFTIFYHTSWQGKVYTFLVLKTRKKDFEVALQHREGTPSLLEQGCSCQAIFSDPQIIIPAFQRPQIFKRLRACSHDPGATHCSGATH